MKKFIASLVIAAVSFAQVIPAEAARIGSSSSRSSSSFSSSKPSSFSSTPSRIGGGNSVGMQRSIPTKPVAAPTPRPYGSPTTTAPLNARPQTAPVTNNYYGNSGSYNRGYNSGGSGIGAAVAGGAAAGVAAGVTSAVIGAALAPKTTVVQGGTPVATGGQQAAVAPSGGSGGGVVGYDSAGNPLYAAPVAPQTVYVKESPSTFTGFISGFTKFVLAVLYVLLIAGVLFFAGKFLLNKYRQHQDKKNKKVAESLGITTGVSKSDFSPTVIGSYEQPKISPAAIAKIPMKTFLPIMFFTSVQNRMAENDKDKLMNLLGPDMQHIADEIKGEYNPNNKHTLSGITYEYVDIQEDVMTVRYSFIDFAESSDTRIEELWHFVPVDGEWKLNGIQVA